MKKLTVVGLAAAVFLLFTACGQVDLGGEESAADAGLAVNPALAQVTAAPETAGDAAAPKPAANQEAAAEPVETGKLLSQPQAAGLPAGAVVVFERSGGLKGIGPATTKWRFYADGRIQASDGRVWQKSPAEIQQLLSDLKANGFFDLEPKYLPADSCCDRYTYVITASDGSQTQRVTTMDGADMPDGLTRILQLFDELLAALAEEG